MLFPGLGLFELNSSHCVSRYGRGCDEDRLCDKFQSAFIIKMFDGKSWRKDSPKLLTYDFDESSVGKKRNQ